MENIAIAHAINSWEFTWQPTSSSNALS